MTEEREITLREHMTRIGKIKTEKKAAACRKNGCAPKKKNPNINIARHYRRRGYSLQRIADKFEVSYGTAHRWCKGAKKC